MKRNRKWKIPHTVFRETNLVLQLIQKSQIKNETAMSWSSQNKKEGIFCTVYFVWMEFFKHLCLSRCIMYWIHFQNIHTLCLHIKTVLHALSYLFLKSPKAFGVSLTLIGKMLIHGSSPTPAPPRPQNNWGGPEQKIKFWGELNLRGGPMNPNDVMIVVLKDILLCWLGFRFIYIVYISWYYI